MPDGKFGSDCPVTITTYRESPGRIRPDGDKEFQMVSTFSTRIFRLEILDCL